MNTHPQTIHWFSRLKGIGYGRSGLPRETGASLASPRGAERAPQVPQADAPAFTQIQTARRS